MNTTTANLSISSLSAGYGAIRILDRVSVSLGSDEIVGILGPNGSGKSTLIKSIMGITTIYSGTIKWKGKDIVESPPYRRAMEGLGYVPQTDNVFPVLTVGENLEMGGYLLSRKEMAVNIQHAYDLFPMLFERRALRAGSLSGGERRMLAIASALMLNPSCLLLDEPSSDLAPAIIDLVFDKISRIRDEYHVPILLVEQNVRRALELSDRIYVLIQGRVRLDEVSADITELELGDLFLEVTT